MDKVNMMIDASTLNTLMDCAEKVHLQSVMRLMPIGEPRTVLELGTMLHEILADYYRGLKEQKSHKDSIPERDTKYQTMTALDGINAERVWTVAGDYFTYYDSEMWTIKEVERPFTRLLYEDDEYRIVFAGKIDLIVESFGVDYLVDHKSEHRRRDPQKLTNQFMGYAWATGIRRFVVNKVGFQKSLPVEDRMRRYLLSYTKDNLDEWRENAIYWTKQLIEYMEEGVYPKNLTSCDKYSGCAFREICGTDRQHRGTKLRERFKVAPSWSPLDEPGKDKDAHPKSESAAVSSDVGEPISSS